jgi:DNA polymerase-3 subunit beta
MLAADTSDGIQINVADLREMIQQVALAASSDEARPVLTGVMVKVEGNTVTMSAADGFRLSRRRLELSSPVSQDFAAIIPARALSELARVAGDADQVVTMSLPKERNQVVFHLKDIELISQLIEGTYPNVEQVIPKSHTTRTIVSTAAFLKACKQAEIFAREGTHIARINIVPGGDLQPGKVEISGQSEETGFNQTDVALLIAFNVRFLREVLEIIKTPNVVLETMADNSPGLIKPAGEQDFLHVIMPMHLGS